MVRFAHAIKRLVEVLVFADTKPRFCATSPATCHRVCFITARFATSSKNPYTMDHVDGDHAVPDDVRGHSLLERVRSEKDGDE